MLKARVLRVGEQVQLRFKVTDTQTGAPKPNLKDMGVLTFLAPGIWQQRDWATAIGDGFYEINFVPPQEGVYYIFFQCPSLGLQYRHLPRLILQATTPVAPAAKPERAMLREIL